MEPTEAAYLAGLIDGEGYVAMQVTRNTNYRQRAQARIQVSMTCCDTIVHISNLAGCGSICEPRREKNSTKMKSQWRWTCASRDAYRVAKAIVPYAITKKEALGRIIAHYEGDDCN